MRGVKRGRGRERERGREGERERKREKREREFANTFSRKIFSRAQLSVNMGNFSVY